MNRIITIAFFLVFLLSTSACALSFADKSQAPELSNVDFVRGLYLTLLDREPDPSGIATYVGGLDYGKLNRAQVFEAISTSPEFKEKQRRKQTEGGGLPPRGGNIISDPRRPGLDDVLGGDGGEAPRGQMKVIDMGKITENGWFEAKMDSWTAPAQGADKSHPLAGWEKVGYGHHKQKGSFWNWRIGKGYQAFKVLAAPQGIEGRQEARVGDPGAVNDGRPHVYRVEWSGGNVKFLFDGQVLKTFKFKRFAIRYFTIGKDEQYPSCNPAPRIYDVKFGSK